MDRPPANRNQFLDDADKEAAASAIYTEVVVAAVGLIGEVAVWGELSNQQRASQLRDGFMRARRLMYVMTNDPNWSVYSSVLLLSDRTIPDENVRRTTNTLLQLIVLSRMHVDSTNNPLYGDGVSNMIAEMGLIREELGITPDGQQHLPGVTHVELIEAICDGRLRIGNPDQPDIYSEPQSD